MPGTSLVIDEVATNRIILRVKLAGACYDVIQASGGIEGLAIARAQRPDLILLDLAMPDLDGTEVCRRLRADPITRETPVIVVTARTDADARRAALSAGADDFLSKPLDDLILLARMRSLLRARSTASELALRESTTRALGFAEPSVDPLSLAPLGRVGLIAGNAELASGWREALRPYLPNRIDVTIPESALREATPDEVADVFIIAETIRRPGDGLHLMSELRAREATRHSAVIMAVYPEAREQIAMALDLGAADMLTLPLDPEETALRLRTQLTRKREADRLRTRLQNGLDLAVIDPLTGLHNRRYGLLHLERVHSRAADRGRTYAVLVLDLDRFKSVNDTYGHAAGDRVISEVAKRLQSVVRPVDLVSRIGGEEFLVVLPDVDADIAQNVATALCDAVSKAPIPLESGEQITQTASVGFALGGQEEDTLNATEAQGAMQRADRALYGAKLAGRNQTRRHGIGLSAA